MKLKIHTSVGRKGKNNNLDVKLIKALLNVYARKNALSQLTINEKANDELEKAIENFQKNHQKVIKPDGQVTSSVSSTFKSLVNYMKSTRTIAAIKKPVRGVLTWDAEGNEGGVFHSRVLHVPSAVSGLTIGRGYDMKNRSSAEVKKDLNNAGVEIKKSELISKAASLFGDKAKQFIIDKDLLDFEITVSTQLKLFENVYKDYVAIVKRICGKDTVVKAYGKTDWDKLDVDIIDLLVDLAFRGDYHGNSRKIIQKSVSSNNFSVFKGHIINKKNWGSWPKDRLERRKEFLDEASKNKRKEGDSTIKKSINEGAKVSVPKPTGTPE